MILLRGIQERDIEALEHFSQIPGFINLPNDRDLLKEKIARSIASFKGEIKDFEETKYLFVVEDLESQRVLGTSMIAAQHGTPDSPHFYFEVGSEEKFSETINTGFIHGTLNLKYETNGPSEIGGLVLYPEHRNSSERIGRQISFVRFLYLALNRSKFKQRIIAELLPPLNKRGQSPLWEAIGRRFTNMDYWEADRLCQKNKEFIFSLFPSGKIYTTFLSAEARHAIGRVGKDTEPVVHMLKKIGFHYENQVDPFDGGPHFWANVTELAPLKGFQSLIFDPGNPESQVEGDLQTGLVCLKAEGEQGFKSIQIQAKIQDGRLYVCSPSSHWVQRVLGVGSGDIVGFMPVSG